MTSPFSPDVIVIGGGPAGSMLAGQLVQAGVGVMALDQSVFPRPKPCGGGLSEKAVRLLDPALDWPSIIEDRCSELRGSWRGETPDRQLLWKFFTGGIFRQGPPDPAHLNSACSETPNFGVRWLATALDREACFPKNPGGKPPD